MIARQHFVFLRLGLVVAPALKTDGWIRQRQQTTFDKKERPPMSGTASSHLEDITDTSQYAEVKRA